MKKVTHKKVENLNTLEKRLVDARTLLNLSQDDLANKTNLTRQHINYFETGARKPDIDKLISIANALNISIDYLLCRTNNRNISNTDISQKIGLSDKSIETLHKFTIKDCYQIDALYNDRFNYQDFFTIINKIIENDNFEKLIYFIRKYINSFKISELNYEINCYKNDDISDNDELYDSDYDNSITDIYNFKITNIFNHIIDEITNQLKSDFSDRWILDDNKETIIKKCKDGSEEITLLKGYGGVKDNGSSRNNKK